MVAVGPDDEPERKDDQGRPANVDTNKFGMIAKPGKEEEEAATPAGHAPKLVPDRKALPTRQSGLFDFANTEAIKEKVRSSKLREQPYNVHDKYHETGCFQWLAKHQYFENTTLGVIIVNALWISIDTDLNHEEETIFNAEPVFLIADILFFTYFSLELVVRFCAFKRKRDCCKDGWFVFDSTLVTLYCFDPFVLGIIAKVQSGGGLDLPTAVLRLFRLARLSRLVRMLRSLPELMIMIKGMLSAASAVGYTLGLLMLITYIFSIAIRNLVSDEAVTVLQGYGVHLESVPEVMHSLIVFGTFLDDLSQLVIPIKEQSTPVFILCWMFIALASMTVMNMLIGVLCEVISAVAAEEKESMMIDKVNERFEEVVHDLDSDHDGNISWDEFVKILDNQKALQSLESVNVDPVGMVDMAEDFFFEDGEPIKVTFPEFMEMVLDLREGQSATVKDLMSLGKRFNKKVMKVREKFDNFDRKFHTLDAKLDALLAE